MLIYYYFDDEYTIWGRRGKLCHRWARFPETINWSKVLRRRRNPTRSKINHPRNFLRRYPWRIVPNIWGCYFEDKNEEQNIVWWHILPENSGHSFPFERTRLQEIISGSWTDENRVFHFFHAQLRKVGKNGPILLIGKWLECDWGIPRVQEGFGLGEKEWFIAVKTDIDIFG